MDILRSVQRSPLAMSIFFLVFTALIAAVHYYLWSRLVRAPELGALWLRWGTVGLIGLGLLLPAGMVVSRMRVLPRGVTNVVAGVAYGWMGLALLLFFVLAGSEIVRAAAHAYAAVFTEPLDQTRRTLLSRGIAGVAGVFALGLTGVGASSALGEVAVRPIKIALKKLPKALSGFRIVQLTDVHIGPTLGSKWLRDVVAKANAEEPDVIVITGDLVDGTVDELKDDIAPLADLKAKHGVFFVTGNHEYYSGADAWIAHLAKMGIRTLRNEHVTIQDERGSFDLAGVDDWSAKRNGHGANLPKALLGRDEGRALVLLAHQPKQFFQAAKLGVGLQLSGHTHGGQIFPWGFLVGLDQTWVAGLYSMGESQIYVSRGTGFWGPPVRVAAPSEITRIELQAA